MNDAASDGGAQDFRLVSLDTLTFDAASELAAMYKLSPFIWQEGEEFRLLLRVVNADENPARKVARIHSGVSNDGLRFTLDEVPVIAPGPDEPGSYDSGGCEDPSAAIANGEYFVYYSGWNEHLKRGELLLAAGPDLRHLSKRGIALASTELTRNPKEATIVRVTDGTWRLFFEFAHEGRSKIGLASSSQVDGPWALLEPLFEARADGWDSWHLSTGPMVVADPMRPVMFYNGGTRQAQWRIGWIVFDATYTRVIARCAQPIVLPPKKRNDDDTDIAFAASAIELSGDVHLYYSIADRYCTRAIIRRA